MSCLNKNYRLKSKKDFNAIYKSGTKWHARTVVIFFRPTQNKFKLAFIASKKIGNAVLRNKAKRRLRAVFLIFSKKIKNGDYIIVAKNAINDANVQKIVKDFNFSFKKLGILQN